MPALRALVLLWMAMTVDSVLNQTYSRVRNRHYYPFNGGIYGKRTGQNLPQSKDKDYDYEPISGSIYGKRSGLIEFKINELPFTDVDWTNWNSYIFPRKINYNPVIIDETNDHPNLSKQKNKDISRKLTDKRTENDESDQNSYPVSGSIFGKRTDDDNSRLKRISYPVSGSIFGKRTDDDNSPLKRISYPVSGSIFGKRTDDDNSPPKRISYPVSGSIFGKRTDDDNSPPKRISYPVSGSIFGKRTDDTDLTSKRYSYPVSGSIFGKRTNTDSAPKRISNPISGSIFGKRTDDNSPPKRYSYPVSGSIFGKRTEGIDPSSENDLNPVRSIVIDQNGESREFPPMPHSDNEMSDTWNYQHLTTNDPDFQEKVEEFIKENQEIL